LGINFVCGGRGRFGRFRVTSWARGGVEHSERVSSTNSAQHQSNVGTLFYNSFYKLSRSETYPACMAVILAIK
jgi:hypothetical protein